MSSVNGKGKRGVAHVPAPFYHEAVCTCMLSNEERMLCVIFHSKVSFKQVAETYVNKIDKFFLPTVLLSRINKLLSVSIYAIDLKDRGSSICKIAGLTLVAILMLSAILKLSPILTLPWLYFDVTLTLS